jgi:hypothetical protein
MKKRNNFLKNAGVLLIVLVMVISTVMIVTGNSIKNDNTTENSEYRGFIGVNSIEGSEIFSQFRSSMLTGIPAFGYCTDGDNLIACVSADGGFTWLFADSGDISLSGNFQGPPEKPSTSGPTEGEVDVEYMFCSTTIDPENDDVYYWFDWGDGTNTGWIGPYPSGMQVCLNHMYTSSGTYCIKVKAKDVGDAESDWSDPLCIDISGECGDFMGIEVCPLGDALLDIDDELRVYNMDDDGEDGVLCIPEPAKDGFFHSISHDSMMALPAGAEITTVYSFSGGGYIGIQTICLEAGDPHQASVSNLGDAGIIAYNGGEIVYEGELEPDGDCGQFKYITRDGPPHQASVSNISATGIIDINWGWGGDIVEWTYDEVTREIDWFEIRGETPGTGEIVECSITGMFPSEHGTGEITIVKLRASNPPDPPEIEGPDSGKVGVPLTYTFTSIDPEGDDVSYYIDWGDGTYTDWTDYQASGTSYSESHTWDEQGTYIIKARALDCGVAPSGGTPGGFASFHTFIPRNKQCISTLFLRFLQQHPNLFQILQYILGLR